MDNNNGMIGTALGSWLVAFAAGTLAGTLLWLLGGWSFLQGAFIGLIVFIVLGGIISWVMTRPLPAPNEATIDVPDAPTVGAAAPAKPAPKAAPEPKADAAPAAKKADPAPAAKAAAPATATSKVKPSKALPGEQELSERKGSWKYEKEGAAKPAPAKKASAKKPAAKEKAAPAATSDARPALMMDAPEGGKADDLKKISGVGPKLEQTLNDLGIWHFHQVAKFTKDDIAWVDDRLRFKGRIERDDWVGQARELAKG